MSNKNILPFRDIETEEMRERERERERGRGACSLTIKKLND